MPLYVKNCNHGSVEENLVLHVVYLAYPVPLPVESMQWTTAVNVGTVCFFNFCYKNLCARRTEKLDIFD